MAFSAVLNNDDLLFAIFMHLPRPVLGRIPLVCKAWQCLVSDPQFLRRYHSFHPPMLGFFYISSCYSPYIPSRSGLHFNSTARSKDLTSFISQGDFSLGFVPKSYQNIEDCRNHRLLLSKNFTEFVVCNPLSRDCSLLPPAPAHVTNERNSYILGTALYAGDGSSSAAFKVVQIIVNKTNMAFAQIFASDEGNWSLPWGAQASIPFWLPGVRHWLPSMNAPSVVINSCLYWLVDDFILMMDMSAIEMSVIRHPILLDRYAWKNTIIGTNKGELCLIAVRERCLRIWHHKNHGNIAWFQEDDISLEAMVDSIAEETCRELRHSAITLVGAGDVAGYVFMQILDCIFAFNLETRELEKTCLKRMHEKYDRIFPYIMTGPASFIQNTC